MFRTGQQVKILPHADLFMMGETRAIVTVVGRKWVHIRGQRSGRLFKFRINTDCLEAA